MKHSLGNGLLAMAAYLVLATGAQAVEHTRYEVINVSPPGALSAEGMSLDSGGGPVVVGFASYSSQRTRGFYWGGSNTVNDLGTLGGQNSKALSISNAHLVGTAQNAAGEDRAFYKSNSTSAMIELQMLPGYTASQASGLMFIYGPIVGSMKNPSLGTHAVLWNDQLSVPTDLGPDAEALAINRGSYIVGYMGRQAVRWDLDTFSPFFLGTLGGSSSVATSMPLTQSGGFPIVGYSKVSGDTATHAFLWDGTAMADLGTLPAGGDSFAYGVIGIGSANQVVGESGSDGISRAFLWENGSMYDLNSFIPSDSGWELLTARGIDQYNNITGTGIYQGKRQAFLLKNPALPTSTASVSGSQGCNSVYITPATVTLTATASQNVGIQEIRYSINGATYIAVPGASAIIDLATQGSYTISYYAVDNGGFVESAKTLSIKIDWTAPTSNMWISAGTQGSSGWYRSDVTMAISYTDEYNIRPDRNYSIDGGAYASLVGPNNSFVVNGDGSHFIDYYAQDSACNAETVKRFAPVPIDITAPVITVGTSPSTLRSSSTSKPVDVTITGTASDATSGVDTVSVNVVDEYGVKNYSGLTFGSVIQLDTYKQKTDKSGRIYTITAVVTDKAGNQATTTSNLIVK